LLVKSPGKTWTSEEKSVTGRLYLDMLELYAVPQLPPQAVLQEDGALPNFCHRDRNHLDKEMARRWIGRGGPIAWPPRSPDLTPLDFLWGYVKNIAYQVNINDLQRLKVCIKDSVATVTSNMLQATWNKVEYHLEICCATKVAHIEIY
jgi:hypothetical protein